MPKKTADESTLYKANMSEERHSVTIHVDGKESEVISTAPENSSNASAVAVVAPATTEVEMANLGVSDKSATDGVNPDVSGTNVSPTAASPQSTMFPGTGDFPLSIENLQRLYKTETTPDEVRSIIRDEYGGVAGLMEKLKSEPTGLDAEMCAAHSQSVVDRITTYGENVLPVAEKLTFFDFCADVLEDPMLRILMVAGVISIVLGTIDHPTSGWYEGSAIIFAIFLVTMVSAGNNYQQQKQFAAVDVSKELDPVTVIRSGKQFSMDPTEILVGDLVSLAAGQRVPADGVLIQLKGKELKINESSATGETGLVEKIPVTKPLLMSGTEVVSGSGVMVVTLVGINTSYGQTLASLVEEDKETPLQQKLELVAKLIGYIGTAFAAATFVALLIYWGVDLGNNKPSTQKWQDLLQIAIVSIGIIVVSVPEGLPLAVTVSLAYSMKAMLKDNILVRELSACETMGNATAICSDKTGTLTQNRMTVQRVYLQSTMNDRPPAREDITPSTLKLLEHAIIMNSAAWIEGEHVNMAVAPHEWRWKDGNQTEVSLLCWLISYGYDVNETRARNASQLKASEPFDSIKKYSSVIIERTPEEIAEEGAGGKRYRQYFKGAAEAIIAQTNRQVGKTGAPIPLNSNNGVLHRELNESVSEFSKRGLRCIAFAYRDLDELPKKKEPKPEKIAPVDGTEEKKVEETTEPGASDDVEAPITDAVLIGMAGLSDPLRPTSYRSVRLCQRAGIIVRMVTGDHVETARFISRECGIWTSKNHLCMTGAEFRKMMAEEDEETKKLKVSRLRVLARSSPQDKQVLVKFLQSQGEIVAATGDGTNDAPALKSADVGIAMFLSGTAVCKSAADLWLMDDNFASIVAAVVWGRCVFDNIRKFLSFQLTVNVVALVLSLVGAIADFPLPLSTVQLLWINLLMDTAAAVALGTEQPIPEELLSRKPKPVDVSLISKAMWFKILSQAAYQLAVLFFLMFYHESLFPDMDMDVVTDPTTGIIIGSTHKSPMDRTEQKTLIFNAFTWMQLCNSFNARRVQPTLNVFGRLFENAYFLMIIVAAMGMQCLMVEKFGSFANTTHQTGPMWGCALVCGVFIWFTNIAYALLWDALVRTFPSLANDDSVRPQAEGAFEGANLHDPRYSFKRPEGADESSQLHSRLRQHSQLRHSFSHEPSGPVAKALGDPAPHYTSSMSARRANPGSARRTNPGAVSFHAVGSKDRPAGELEAHAVPVASGPSKEQLAASASWPRAPIESEGVSNKALGSHQKQQAGGVQVIEELDELL